MAREENLTPLQEEAIENLKMWMRNPQGINLGAALGYSEFDIHNLGRLAHSLLEQGKLEEARAIYEGIHAMSPENPQAMLGLGSIYTQQGHMPQAIELFSRVLEEEPENLFAILQRSECYIRSNDMEKAVEGFKKILEIDPDAAANETKRAIAIIASAQKMAEEAGVLPSDFQGVGKKEG